MVVGQLNNMKVGFVIQARMRSTRLPGKILMPLPINGKTPLLKQIIDQLKRTKFKAETIVATSTNSENDILEDFCKAQNVAIFRGNEDDVLSRFVSIADSNPFDIIVRLTADNPFIDIQVLDNLIETHLCNSNKYTCSKGLPIGMNFELVDPLALVESYVCDLSPEEKEHVTIFIRNNYPIQTVDIKTYDNLKDIRLTIDYPSDFALASILFSLLDQESVSQNGLLNSLNDIIVQNPWLKEINNSNFQKKQFDSKYDELLEATAILESLEMRSAKNVVLQKLNEL